MNVVDYKKLSAKTASYAMTALDLGTVFTNRGAGAAITFTLPPTADIQIGWWARVNIAANQSVTVAAETADTLNAFNDIAADSIAFSTSNEKVGAGVEFVWDGTGWLTFVSLGMDSQTPTIAT